MIYFYTFEVEILNFEDCWLVKFTRNTDLESLKFDIFTSEAKIKLCPLKSFVLIFRIPSFE